MLDKVNQGYIWIILELSLITFIQFYEFRVKVGINLAIKELIDHIRIYVSLFIMMGLKDDQITVLMNLLEKLHDLIWLIEFFVTN